MNTIAHTNQIVCQMRVTHGDTIANTWQPMIEASIIALHNGNDLHAPIVINGKQISIGGQVATAIGVLDLIADTLGVEAISQSQWFNTCTQ